MAWSLSDSERADVIERITANIAALSFFQDKELSEEVSRNAAIVLERKAYTAAQVAARTTTGHRPRAETTTGYARKLGELVVEAVKSGGRANGEAVAAAGDAEEINLVGSRDFMTSESTSEALQAMLAPGTKVSKIRFSTKSFSRDAADVASRAIANANSTLREADLSDIIAGRPEDEALEVLRILSRALAGCQLRHLNLSDNALGEKGVRACAEALTAEPGLEFLSLQNVGCSINACAAVAELVTISAQLRSLQLFNNMSDNAGAQHIASILARAPRMEDFRMASSRVGPQGGAALAQALSTGRCLVKLDLSDNPMTADVAPALAQCIQQQTALRILNLNDTSLTDEGIQVVSRALAASACQLEELELALNEITPVGARDVALAVASKRSLTKLNVRENELEDRGAAIISKALSYSSQLQVLDMCMNQIGRLGALAAARAVAAGGKKNFKLLALDENQISESGVEQMQDVIRQAFGGLDVLGPLDENDPDAAEDEDEEDADAMDADPTLEDELSAALSKAAIS